MVSIPDSFWLATFEVDAPPPSNNRVSAVQLESPGNGAGKQNAAIEILRSDTEYAVAVSSVNDVASPGDLTCHIAFANGVGACDLARRWGFPVVEAKIKYDQATGVMRIVAPFFPTSSEVDTNVIRYESPLLEVRGVEFAPATGEGNKLDITYHQSIVAPDAARPDAEIRLHPAILRTSRIAFVQQPRGEIALDVAPSRFPDLMHLANRKIDARIWSGSVSYRPKALPTPRTPPKREPRVDSVVSGAYRFEDVEVLGFRIDLRELGAEADRFMESLIAPLNFHRDASAQTAGHQSTAGLADFYYGAAARALVIELLRYGKMKLDRPFGPLTPDDCQSQHELLVRVLVGRLDDDTAQARDAAVFVPAIFVDNQWSKVVGREAQGFDKQLASFCIAGADGPLSLRPDGRLPGAAAQDSPQPLGRVCQVSLVPKVGDTSGHPILDLDLGSAALDDEAFRAAELPLASGQSWLAGLRWRQTDFDAAEFRRSFARPVIADGISRFRSVQVGPVDDRGLEKTWIQGTFSVDRVRLALPVGVATLTVHAPSAAPDPWKLLHGLLARAGRTSMGLPTGDWYRLHLSMGFDVDDGLAW